MFHKHWCFFCSECFLANQSNFSTTMSLERNWTGNATLIPGSILSFETTTLWPITTINYITVAFIFSKGKPFRKPIYTNCKYIKFNFSFWILSHSLSHPRVVPHWKMMGWGRNNCMTLKLLLNAVVMGGRAHVQKSACLQISTDII